MWIARAESDFRSAEQLMASPDPAVDAICFHAHGCAEKLLKALIVSRGVYPPRTHILTQLLHRQPPSLRNDKALESACALLQSLYPQSRYPEAAMPTIDQARRALEAARAVRDRIVSVLNER